MSNMTGEGESLSSENNTGGGGGEEVQQQQLHGPAAAAQPSSPPVKKKRNLPGTPDPTAEVVALSPATLMATNRFVCEICNKGFQRDQNLQLHRRGHNLPWKLRQRAAAAEVRKRVYVCPEPSCVHHNPGRALGDLTGIKKHFCRKHGEKKWKCDKCSKKYAVQSDWKAHSKTCGTREYKCDCGTIFSRRDSFITHRAFCDALAEENSKSTPNNNNNSPSSALLPALPELMIPASSANSAAMGPEISIADFNHAHHASLVDVKHPAAAALFKPSSFSGTAAMLSTTTSPSVFSLPSSSLHLSPSAASTGPAPPAFDGMKSMMSAAHMSATALLQKAAQMGATAGGATAGGGSMAAGPDMRAYNPAAAYGGDGIGMMDGGNGNGYVNGSHGHSFDGPVPVEQGRFLKSLAQEMHARSSTSMMTVDFLGVGGAPRPVPVPVSLQQQGLQHQFHHHHQQLSANGQSNGMDKSLWGDV